MAFSLTDDGTLDTVVRCDDCGEEVRFTRDRAEELERDDTGAWIVGNCRYKVQEIAEAAAYDEYVLQCLEEAAEDHDCQPEDE